MSVWAQSLPASTTPSAHGEWLAKFAKSVCILHYEAQHQSVQPLLLPVICEWPFSGYTERTVLTALATISVDVQRHRVLFELRTAPDALCTGAPVDRRAALLGHATVVQPSAASVSNSRHGLARLPGWLWGRSQCRHLPSVSSR